MFPGLVSHDTITNMRLSDIQTLLIDGDGVLWRGEKPMPGLNDFMSMLAQRGIRWALLTNNSSNPVDYYYQKLLGFGIQHDPGAIFSSNTVTVEYLKKTYPAGSLFYVVGMNGLVETLEGAGLSVITGEGVDGNVAAVITGLDRAFSYGKLSKAMQFLMNGADHICTNRDPSFPTPDGLTPGAGTMVAAVETASGIPARLMGKPEPEMFQYAMRYLEGDSASTAMLGDRIDTDIRGAERVGIGRILVLSGVTTSDMLTRYPSSLAHHTFPSIAELGDALANL